jgi:hypothetical protein
MIIRSSFILPFVHLLELILWHEGRRRDEKGSVLPEYVNRWIFAIEKDSPISYHQKKIYFVVIFDICYLTFDILSLKFGLVNCLWDKIMICRILNINVSSCCYLNSVELLSKNNYIIHIYIFTISIHWNIIRNLRKHQIFPSTSELLSFLADRLLYRSE